MRNIKFRAWNSEEEIMCYDNEDDSACYWDGVVASNVGLINSNLSNNRGYQYMQYTGFKDKSGTEIYEGDIVGAFSGTQRSVVKWNDWYGLFEITLQVSGDSELSSELLANHLGSIEVVGNKYEHPHLLEEERT